MFCSSTSRHPTWRWEVGPSPSASSSFQVPIWFCSAMLLLPFYFSFFFFFPTSSLLTCEKSSAGKGSCMSYMKLFSLTILESLASYTFCYVWLCVVEPKIYQSFIIQIFLAFLGRFQDVAVLLVVNFWFC